MRGASALVEARGGDDEAAGTVEQRLSWMWLLPVSAQGGRLATLGFAGSEIDVAVRYLRTTLGSCAGPLVGLVNADIVPYSRENQELLTASAHVAVVGRRGAMGGWERRLREQFPRVQIFGLVAPRAPRVVVPLHDAKRAIRALSLHRPGRRIARLAVFAAKALLRCGLTAPLRQRVLCIATRDIDALPVGAVRNGMPGALRDYRGEYALYLGTAQRDRKLVALPVDDDAPPMLVKMASTPESMRAVEHEAHVLGTMAASSVASSVPRCLQLYRGDSEIALFQEYRRRVHASEATLAAAAVHFLSVLSRMGRDRVAVGHIQNRLVRELQGPEVSKCARDVLATVMRKSTHVWTHRTHGDFAPWNCAWSESGFYVFDWEESDSRGLAFADAFYFAIASDIQTRTRRSPDQLLKRALGVGRRVAESAGIPSAEVELHFGIWIAHKASAADGALYQEVLEAFARQWK
jgi:hypothetical protein